MPNISLAKPFLNDAEERAVLEVLRSGWLSSGPRCLEFEELVANFIGRRYAVAVNSGTSAIHLALMAAGVTLGDEVIVPAFTCVAALHPIIALGAVPVPVDIDIKTFAIDPSCLAASVTSRTRGVLYAHLFGIPGSVSDVATLCRTRNLFLIEDIALALGAYQQTRHVGTIGDFACLSFHPRKMITTGEGGMVLTNSESNAIILKELRNYGASVQAWHRHRTDIASLPKYDRPGFNYKLTDIQAAIGIEQVHKLPEIFECRRRIAGHYDKSFDQLPWLKVMSEPAGIRFGYQSYVALVDLPAAPSSYTPDLRDRLITHLTANGIASVQAAQAMPSVAYYARHFNWPLSRFPQAMRADASTIALPIYPTLRESEQEQIIAAVRNFRL